MTAKKKWKKPILIPQAEERMHALRYEITKQKGWLDVSAGEQWWEVLHPMQQSEVNGLVTKMMVARAQEEILKKYSQK